MNKQQVWRRDVRGGRSERIEDHYFGTFFGLEFYLQLGSGERNG